MKTVVEQKEIFAEDIKPNQEVRRIPLDPVMNRRRRYVLVNIYFLIYHSIKNIS